MKQQQQLGANIYLSKTRIAGLGLLVLTLAIWIGTNNSPELVEQYYSRSLYPIIASVFAAIGSKLPIALADFVLIFGVGFYLYIPVYSYRRYKPYGLKICCAHSLIIIATFSGYLLFLAVFTFVFNHHRLPATEIFQLPEKLTEEDLSVLLSDTGEKANALSANFNRDQEGCSQFEFELASLDELVEREQNHFLESRQLPAINTATTRHFFFGDIWLGMGVAGMFQSLVGQTNIPPGLPNHSMPFIVGHERGHLNGFASEAAATLVALQTMFHSEDNRLQYLALHKLWRKGNAPENINSQVVKDIACFEKAWQQTPKYALRKLTRQIIDAYLKLSGHKDGIKNYNRGAALGLRYYFKYLMTEVTLGLGSQPS